jgi:hypothetical protein
MNARQLRLLAIYGISFIAIWGAAAFFLILSGVNAWTIFWSLFAVGFTLWMIPSFLAAWRRSRG